MIDMFYGIDQLMVSQVHTYIQIHQIVYIKHVQLKKKTFYFVLEYKQLTNTTHSSILAWRIPWTGGLLSTGSQSVRHD